MAGFEEFQKYCETWTDKSLQSDLKDFMQDFLGSEAQKVIGRTKNRTPVDTGALKASWQLGKIKVSNNVYSVEILNNMDYASFVEYGTVERNWKYKDGVFMLTISLNEVEQNIHQDFDKQFTRFLKNKGIG